MRGCFGGFCSFCSITEHEGRIIQGRSEDSIINGSKRSATCGAGVYRRDLHVQAVYREHVYAALPASRRVPEQTCRRLSCVYPDICPHMDTDHTPTINLYRRARELKGIKKILIASGVRYDITLVEDPRYIKEAGKPSCGRLSEDCAGAY